MTHDRFENRKFESESSWKSLTSVYNQLAVNLSTFTFCWGRDVGNICDRVQFRALDQKKNDGITGWLDSGAPPPGIPRVSWPIKPPTGAIATAPSSHKRHLLLLAAATLEYAEETCEHDKRISIQLIIIYEYIIYCDSVCNLQHRFPVPKIEGNPIYWFKYFPGDFKNKLLLWKLSKK